MCLSPKARANFAYGESDTNLKKGMVIKMNKYVIIGNGTAAAGCIEGIRSVDSEGSITVVSKENRPVYCRPLISYYLEGKTRLENIGYRPGDFYEKNGCRVLYGKSAAKIDSKGKKVYLEGGTSLYYDSLCVAAGSSPFVPPMAGLETVEKKFGFMTLDDALEVENAITPASRVLIVGAGLIGLKCAEGILDRVASVTVCDLADRVLSSILDSDGAAMMKKHLEERGMKFMLGDTAASFDKNTAHMKSGADVEFDVLILAVGVRANTSIVKDAGGEVGRGIRIGSRCETSIADVYAAGDCTETRDVSDGSVKVMALMPNAYMEGHCAGVNMAGGEEFFDNAIPMNSIGFFGLHAMTAGSRKDPAEGGEVYEDVTGEHIKKLYCADGKLCGFELIGDNGRAGIYTDLIRRQVPLDTVDFEKLQIEPNLFGFSEDYRRKKLGGVV